MKHAFSPRKARVLAPLLAATALVATPVLAQDTAPQAAPQVTPPSSATVPIPPVVRTVPDGTPPAASTEPAAPPARAPRAAPRATTTATRTTRAATRSTTATTAPAIAPAPQPAAPASQPQASLPPAPEAAPVNAPAPPAADSASTSTTTTTSTSSGIPGWAWAAGAVALLAIVLGAILAMRRRRDEYDYDEPAYVEDTYVEPAPVTAAPVIERAAVPVAKPAPRKEPEVRRRRTAAPEAETVIAAPDEVHMESAPSDDLAALTAGETVAERPWLEFAIRPVRAGTNVDEALVEIELTVGNAGSIAASDVRISTFLLSGDPHGSEMERLLTNPPADSTTDPVTIKPGEGKRIDATLALLKSEMGDVLPESIRPIIVADARYTLPDGSEGRTSASFMIGVTDEVGHIEPIEMARASMHDNVAAELHGEAQHA